jgi:hypothetical protein
MYIGLLHLHNLLRWVILLLLLWNIVKLFSGSRSLGVSKALLIATHTTVLIGLYQYFFGKMGFALFQEHGSEVMKLSALRFWAVEHITTMLLAAVLITVGHVSFKKGGTTKKTAVLYTIAFILILAAIPWPFRDAAIAKPLFPGMH